MLPWIRLNQRGTQSSTCVSALGIPLPSSTEKKKRKPSKGFRVYNFVSISPKRKKLVLSKTTYVSTSRQIYFQSIRYFKIRLKEAWSHQIAGDIFVFMDSISFTLHFITYYYLLIIYVTCRNNYNRNKVKVGMIAKRKQ